MLARAKIIILTTILLSVLILVQGGSITAAPPQTQAAGTETDVWERVTGNPSSPPHSLSIAAGTTTRVSVASDGSQGNGPSGAPYSISADGRYVAFPSSASNLIDGDTNGVSDVFVRDQQTGQITRVSVTSGGGQAFGGSSPGFHSISADGRYVAFLSDAYNLVSGDTNGVYDVFVHDRQTGQTTRVSVASDGSQGNAWCFMPSISADGRYVAFYSSASNLVDGDTNDAYDIFVHDRQTGQTTRVSVASDGSQGNGSSFAPAISADGRYVAFESWANNLVDGDTNDAYDIFVHDRQTGQTTRVSVASDGSQGNNQSYWTSISADGRYVVFESEDSNLVSGDNNGAYDIFVHDRQTGQTTRVSVASDGSQGNGYSVMPTISANGRYVVFHSSASNLVDGDTNGTDDVFVHDREGGLPPMPKGFTYDGPRYMPTSGLFQGREVMLDEDDEKITMGDHVHFQLPFTNNSGQTVANAYVTFDGVARYGMKDVWVARSDDLDTWSQEMVYHFGTVSNGQTVWADIWVYVDNPQPEDRTSLRGAAVLRMDYGQEHRDSIGITLEPIMFTPSSYTELTYNDDCLHHPSNFSIVRYAQYAAGDHGHGLIDPIPGDDPNSLDPDTLEQTVRNLVATVSDEDEFKYDDLRKWPLHRVPDTELLFARGHNIGVCRHYADLGVGLLRSLGIPTRWVSAVFFKEAESKSVGHAWTEVYTGTVWRQADPTWNAVFQEGIYEEHHYTVEEAWADYWYPLAAVAYDRCAPSCYLPPVDCARCLQDIHTRSGWYAGCTKDVRSQYHSVSLDRMQMASADEGIAIHIQAPIFVTRTHPFTLTARLVNSTTQTLNTLTSTLSLYEDALSTTPLYNFTPINYAAYNIAPGETVTVTWTITPLVAGNNLPLRVTAFSEDMFDFNERPLIVNEPGTSLPLTLGSLCGPGTVHPGQSLTLTASVLGEILQPLTDTLTSVNATIYVTPTLDYSTTVPLTLQTDGFFRQLLALPINAPVGTYLVEYAATRSGYDAAESIASFYVSPPLSVTLVASSDSLDIDKPFTLTVGVVDRTMAVTEASVWAAISTPGGAVTVPLLYGDGVYTTTFRPIDLAPDLGGTISGGQWQITVTVDYYGSTAAASKTITVWSRVYLPLALCDY